MCLNIFVHVSKCAGGTIQSHVDHGYRGEEKLLLRSYYKAEAILDVLTDVEREEWNAGSPLKKERISACVQSLSDSRRKAIRFVYGHAVYYGIHELFEKQSRYFAFLREPLARFVSFYNYISSVRAIPERLRRYELQKEDGSFRSLEEWLAVADLNQYSMTGFLLQVYGADGMSHPASISFEEFEQIKKMLASFYFVGLTENEDDMEFTLNRLGITKHLPDKNVLRTKDIYVRPKSEEEAKKIVAARCPLDVELYAYATQLNREMKKQIKDYDRAVVYTRFRRKISRSYYYVTLPYREELDLVKKKARRLIEKLVLSRDRQ